MACDEKHRQAAGRVLPCLNTGMVFFLSFREICLAWLSFYFVHGNRLGKAVSMKLPQHFGMRMIDAIYHTLAEAEVRVYLDLKRTFGH